MRDPRAELDKEARRLAGIAEGQLGVRLNWHEPDEQDVTAEVVGTHLDNAFGDHIDETQILGGRQEQIVIIRKEGRVVTKINLATLLALATFHYRL